MNSPRRLIQDNQSRFIHGQDVNYQETNDELFRNAIAEPSGRNFEVGNPDQGDYWHWFLHHPLQPGEPKFMGIIGTGELRGPHFSHTNAPALDRQLHVEMSRLVASRELMASYKAAGKSLILRLHCHYRAIPFSNSLSGSVPFIQEMLNFYPGNQRVLEYKHPSTYDWIDGSMFLEDEITPQQIHENLPLLVKWSVVASEVHFIKLWWQLLNP